MKIIIKYLQNICFEEKNHLLQKLFYGNHKKNRKVCILIIYLKLQLNTLKYCSNTLQHCLLHNIKTQLLNEKKINE